MGGESESLTVSQVGFELSAEERQLVGERLRALHDRWASRLEEGGVTGLTIAEARNLFDNLVFDADQGEQRSGQRTLDSLISRLDAALEQAGDEQYVPKELLPRYQSIVALTDQFCQERLNDEYRALCRRAAAALCQGGSPAVRGKPASWASGVVNAVGWVNFLSDPSFDPYVRTEEIAEWFGVSVATMHNKAKTLRDGLDLMRFHPDFTLPSRKQNNPFFQLSALLARIPDMGGLRVADEEPLVKTGRDVSLGFILKITLRDVKPAVWRRVQTPDCTLEELHEIIQTAMGWQDCHMHEFRVGDAQIVSAAMDELEEAPENSRQEADVLLSEIYAASEKRIDYMYDFGDGWEHEIVIEKSLSGHAVGNIPICTGGARACPPEDVGGPWGYAEFLEAMADPEHERHAELQEWYGEAFDPSAFDRQEVNLLLAR
jgi:hypothetical protein